MRPAAAVRVAAGVLTSRLFGLLRERMVAHYFGVGAYADVFATALRGPNVVQNLLGEQALSAAFIPIYSRKLSQGDAREAGRFAGAIFGLLLAAAALLTLAGVLFARPIVAVLATGYFADAALIATGEGSVDRFELAVMAVRLLFPMTGFLVLAAWCLGVLNSHRRFFLPYFSPVLWNSAIIAALVWMGSRLAGEEGPRAGRSLLYAACVGALVGGVLQFLVQLPAVARVLRGFRLSWSTRVPGVREALTNFVPVVAGRGVVQLSHYVDLFVASFLSVGALGALSWAQRLATLPLSLFGISFAAAELPELSRIEDRPDVVASRLGRALSQAWFLTVPATVGYLVFGFVFVGALYRTGSFGLLDNWLVYLVLGGYTLGLLPNVASRLLQTPFYARRDTRTPALIAALRVVVTAVLGVLLSFWWDGYRLAPLVRPLLGPFAGEAKELGLGAVGLAVAAAVGSWLELVVLVRALGGEPRFRLPWGAVARMAGLAVLAALPPAAAWPFLGPWHPVLLALVLGGAFAILYLVLGVALGRRLGLPEADLLWSRVRQKSRAPMEDVEDEDV